jgi:hypothetical protein
MVIGDVGGEKFPKAALRAGIPQKDRRRSTRTEAGDFPALHFGFYGTITGNDRKRGIAHWREYT